MALPARGKKGEEGKEKRKERRGGGGGFRGIFMFYAFVIKIYSLARTAYGLQYYIFIYGLALSLYVTILYLYIWAWFGYCKYGLCYGSGQTALEYRALSCEYGSQFWVSFIAV